MSLIVREPTPFSIKLDGKEYPVTLTYRIRNIAGDMWDTDRPTIQVRAKLPNDYPETKVIKRVREYYKDKGDMFYEKDGIAQADIKSYKDYFYVIRFFVYPSLFPKDLSEEEKKGLKGLGKYILCRGLNIFIKMGFKHRKITLAAGGFGMVERDPFTEEEVAMFYHKYPHYLEELPKKIKKIQDYWAKEDPTYVFTQEQQKRYARTSAQLTAWAMSLVNYYRLYGFETDDKHIFDHFIEGAVRMSAKTDDVLEYCRN